MKFTKYNSIESHERSKTINMIRMSAEAMQDEFVCTQKIHGSNFSFWYDGNTFKCAKRTGFLGDNANFYNQSIITEKNKDKVIQIYNLLKQTYEFEVLTVCGETFGGYYPCKDVSSIPGVMKVQKGVGYTPDAEFYAFDIKIDNQYLNYDKAVEVFKATNMIYAEILCRGTLDECLQYPNEYQTTLPEKFGLPPIENNVCEGNVIKTVNYHSLPDGSRVIIKNKNSKFKEKENKKNKISTKKAVLLTEQEQNIINDLQEYITENRLRNVISHVGQITHKDYGKLLGLYSKDIWEEYYKDNQEEFDTIETDKQKLIRKMINGFASKVIKDNIVNIIDGEF